MRKLLYLTFFAALSSVAACKADSGDEPTSEPVSGLAARQALLTSYSNNVVLPLLAQFESEAQALVVVTAEYVENPDVRVLARAQEAYRFAMATWQQLELMQIGPGATAGTSPGAADLRAEIYSWPLTNPCRVDQETVAGTIWQGDAISAAAVNVRGLDAIEYLLFDADTNNACPANMPINADGQWAALSAEETVLRRARYANAVASDVAATATALRTAWSPEGGNFAAELATAGQGSSSWSSTQAALNAVTDALFYLEKETKDMKLARPMGLIDCAEATCPELEESRFASDSLRHVRANVAGFRAAFVGSASDDLDGEGFDDLLAAIGAAELGARILAEIAAVDAALDAVGVPLADALAADDPALLGNVYNSLRTLTTTVKTDLLSTLDLDLPARAEGDND